MIRGHFGHLLPPRQLYKAAPEHVRSPHLTQSRSRSARSSLDQLSSLPLPVHSLPVAFVPPPAGRSTAADEVSSPRAASLERETKREREREREREKIGQLAKIERNNRARKRGSKQRDRGSSEGRPQAGGKIEGSVRRKLMRLLSFVPFGCRAGPIDDAPPAADHAAGGDASATTAAASRRRRRRRRRAAAAAAAAQQYYYWRPSLGDIYEEHSTADAAKAAGGGPARPRKAASWDVARVLPRDEYRNLESASSMPAFAPTAYLF